MINLAHPGWLWLLPVLLIPLIAWYIYSQDKNEPEMNVSSTRAFDHLGTSWKVWAKHLSFALKLGALACLIVILCRPQSKDSWSTSDVEGTDIVIAMDVSTSMLAKDFSPNRFESAKKVATQFVSGRDHDNIGLVLFAGESFTQVPMTMDNATLVNAIGQTQIGALEDGTAEYPVAIDYAGRIQYQRMPVVIDETTLKNIATATGGKYFRATSGNVLREIFKEIDQLEKTHMDVQRFTHTEDHYEPWALLLLGLLLLSLLLDYTLLRHIP